MCLEHICKGRGFRVIRPKFLSPLMTKAWHQATAIKHLLWKIFHLSSTSQNPWPGFIWEDQNQRNKWNQAVYGGRFTSISCTSSRVDLLGILWRGVPWSEVHPAHDSSSIKLKTYMETMRGWTIFLNGYLKMNHKNDETEMSPFWKVSKIQND